MDKNSSARNFSDSPKEPVVNMTRVLQELIDEGYPVTPAIIARLSPYK
jgi:hypothetical protein